MSMNFGKGNRSIAFNPTSAFPLDARSYFESYSDAVAAATKAEAAGSTNTEYYYGQTLVVVENEKAIFYIIQPDNTLSSVSSGNGEGSSNLEIDANQFEFDENGVLIIRGSKAAEAGSLVSIDANGVISWVAPIDAYTKDETNEAIRSAVASAAHIKRKIVADEAEIESYMATNDDAEQYIYMVPTGLEEDSDRYDEYMVIAITDSEGVITKYIEKVGSWEVNLTDYAKTSDVNNALNNKVDKQENARLITNAEAEKLAALVLEAEHNVINSVSNDFTVDDNRQLILNDISISKVTNLQELLDNKVDSKEGYTLLSPTDKDKLDALVLGDNGNLEISGTVNAENVQGLAAWLGEHAAYTTGLSENNLSNALYNKLSTNLSIISVDPELQVVDKQLSIVSVDSSKVVGLTDLLAGKATVTSVETVSANMSALEALLDSHVRTANAKFEEIDDRLTWKSIT